MNRALAVRLVCSVQHAPRWRMSALLRHSRLLALLLINVWPSVTAAQTEWRPSRNVEIIVLTAAGGASDRAARAMQRILQDKRLVETTTAIINKPGGGGVIAYNYLAQHPGDAHYWVLASFTLLTSYARGQSKLHYTDVTPLAMLFSEYSAGAIRADSRFKDGKSLLDMLVKNPQDIVMGISPAVGAANHLALAMAVKAAGGDVKRLKTVVFNSSTEATVALLGGHVEAVVLPASALLPHVASGKLQVVAVSSPKRLGGVLAASPTWGELGVPVVFGNWRAVVGPKDLADAQVAYWGNVFNRMVRNPEWKEYIEKNLLSEFFMDGKESVKFLDTEYKSVAAIMKELDLAK